jgi:hypothetical protein
VHVLLGAELDVAVVALDVCAGAELVVALVDGAGVDGVAEGAGLELDTGVVTGEEVRVSATRPLPLDVHAASTPAAAKAAMQRTALRAVTCRSASRWSTEGSRP